jgi:hypothetical protein
MSNFRDLYLLFLGVCAGTYRDQRHWSSGPVKKAAARGVVAHTFNPSAREAEAGGFLSSRPAWSTKWAPGQPGLHRETLSRKTKKKKKKRRQQQTTWVLGTKLCALTHPTISPPSTSNYFVVVFVLFYHLLRQGFSACPRTCSIDQAGLNP